MRDGYKVLDADTHLQPSVETILPYLDPELRRREAEFERFKRPVKVSRASEPLKPPYRHWYRFHSLEGWGGAKARRLGEAGPSEHEERHRQQFMGRRFPAAEAEDWGIDVRVREMDEEGVDVEMLVPHPFLGHEDPSVEMGFIRAVHRFLDDVSSRYPDRFRSRITVTSRAVEESVDEIARCAKSKWAAGVKVELPLDFPLDHPDLEPIWRAADEHALCVTHHSFSAGYPGYRDLWDNPFLGRTASHPWAAMRAIAAFFGAGIMDRYPNLKLCILESGFGWLPFWMRRMEDQVTYMGYVADLQHSMEEYMTGGRFFAGIVLHEGPEMVRLVNEAMGDQVLMFGSDYPHAESRFPDSVDVVLGWDGLSDDARRKLLWDNGARCFDVT